MLILHAQLFRDWLLGAVQHNDHQLFNHFYALNSEWWINYKKNYELISQPGSVGSRFSNVVWVGCMILSIVYSIHILGWHKNDGCAVNVFYVILHLCAPPQSQSVYSDCLLVVTLSMKLVCCRKWKGSAHLLFPVTKNICCFCAKLSAVMSLLQIPARLFKQ